MIFSTAPQVRHFLPVRHPLAKAMLPGLLLLSGLLLLLATSVEAKGLCPWCKEEKRSAAYRDPSGKVIPPPKDVEKLRCDPVREQVVALNRQPWILRAATVPYAGILKRRHHACMAGVKDWKHAYLEEVELRGDDGPPPSSGSETQPSQNTSGTDMKALFSQQASPTQPPQTPLDKPKE
ncbi:MAG: hypothetical protein SFZ03_12430 [Candidatus Melainabacteria bacterium]|nr:hypothetical protein [Candidatus Melainabacteria bacterium]